MITFLHGFLGSPEDWKEVQDELSLPSIALSLPGHGDAPLDFETFEKQIPEQAILVGYSMGGRLALHYAKKHPKKVKELILLSVNPGLKEGREERQAWDEMWIAHLQNEGMESFLEKWYKQELFSSFRFTEKIKQRRMKYLPDHLAEVMRDYSPAKMENLWPHLPYISSPLLFLFGENDIKYHAIGAELQPNFECAWIPNASHAIHLEAPKEVAHHIMRRIS